MENTEITIVVSSRSLKEEKTDFIKNIEDTCGVKYRLIFITNNGNDLTKVYNNMFQMTSTDIVIFMHDDIEFLKYGWGEEVVRLFNDNQEYGIIGVAGSAEFDDKAAWWQYKKIYGQVMHKSEGKVWLSAFSPLLKKDLEEVCVIDGLFMAVHNKRIIKRFDNDLKGFHMYDIDFCLSNFLTNEVKIGVTTNIRIAHCSVGKLSNQWYENRDFINDKFKNNYPIKV